MAKYELNNVASGKRMPAFLPWESALQNSDFYSSSDTSGEKYNCINQAKILEGFWNFQGIYHSKNSARRRNLYDNDLIFVCYLLP